MIFGFIVFLSVAAAMSAPASPAQKDEALRALMNPSPEMLQELNQLGAKLRTMSSLAATNPELALTPEAREVNSQANLNLLGGLENIVTRLVTSFLDKLLSGGGSQAGGSGTGSGVPATGSGANPQVPVGPSMPNPFDPLGFLFPGGGSASGSSPFSMFFSPMMFGNMFEGLMEMF